MTAPIQHQTHRSDPGTAAQPALAYLRLVGVSEEGTRLRLVDEEGAEHVLAVDDRLRAAVAPSTPPTSRGMEKTMESTLRPRDIQARIRSGETPEAVAQAAQTSVDKIMAFAAPVLAERQHVAERAQRSSVRRSDAGQATGARTLGDAVAAQLRSHNIDPQTVEWDAWRREDGRWSLIAGYDTPERSGAAELTFDAPGNYVTLDNEDARWLVGIAIPVADAPPARADDLQAARERRLGSVDEPTYDDQLPLGDALGDDAIDLVTEQPMEAFLDTEPATDEQVVVQEAELREEATDAAAEEPEPARKPAKKRGRASVPSWDEIMFGGGDKV
ncbi:septation protein SepH [Nocardioides endophyticus]|uniref:Septation protein SepH n=1 Tax=Nocardioides endophyticus TaxID=1353775 RepID=A0ABP8YZV7_9ACTN